MIVYKVTFDSWLNPDVVKVYRTSAFHDFWEDNYYRLEGTTYSFYDDVIPTVLR